MTPEGRVKQGVKKRLDELGAWHFWPVQGYGCRLSPTANVPSHTSGAAPHSHPLVNQLELCLEAKSKLTAVRCPRCRPVGLRRLTLQRRLRKHLVIARQLPPSQPLFRAQSRNRPAVDLRQPGMVSPHVPPVQRLAILSRAEVLKSIRTGSPQSFRQQRLDGCHQVPP